MKGWIKTLFLCALFFCLSNLMAWGGLTIKDEIKRSKELFNSGKYQDALGAALTALSHAEQIKNEQLILDACLQVGTMYYYNDQSNKEKVLSYYYRVMHLAMKNKRDTILGRIYHNIGVCHIEEKHLDSATFYMKRSIAIIKELKDYKRLAKAYSVMSELYKLNKADQSKIFPTVQEGYKYALLSGDSNEIAFSLMKFGIYYYDHRNYSEAYKYYLKADSLYCKLNDIQGRRYSLRNIANALGKRDGDHIRKAFDRYIKLNDSLFAMESANQVGKYEALYKTEKANRINKQLQQENELKQQQLNTRNIAIIALAILIALIVALVLWRLNVIRLRKQKEEIIAMQKLESERKRISRDLHDNVGALASFVFTKIDWITRNKPLDLELKADLLLLKSSTAEITEGLRDAIWTLNSPAVTNMDLTDKIKVYAKKHLLIPVVLQDELLYEKVLPNAVVMAVYRCCQEIINNITKHSKATNVEIYFSDSKTESLVITISDNGIGINPQEQEKENHYGLRNLKMRLQEVNGELLLKTSTSGTIITIKI